MDTGTDERSSGAGIREQHASGFHSIISEPSFVIASSHERMASPSGVRMMSMDWSCDAIKKNTSQNTFDVYISTIECTESCNNMPTSGSAKTPRDTKRKRPILYTENPQSSHTKNVVHLYVWKCLPKHTRHESFTPLFDLFPHLIENGTVHAALSGLLADEDHPGFNVTVNRRALDEAVKSPEKREMLEPFITWMLEQQWCSEAQTAPVVGEGAPAEQNLGVAAFESVQQTVVPPIVQQTVVPPIVQQTVVPPIVQHTAQSPAVQQTVVPPVITAVAMSPDRSCELKTQIETARLRTLESEMRAAQAQERAAEAEAQAAEAAAKAAEAAAKLKGIEALEQQRALEEKARAVAKEADERAKALEDEKAKALEDEKAKALAGEKALKPDTSTLGPPASESTSTKKRTREDDNDSPRPKAQRTDAPLIPSTVRTFLMTVTQPFEGVRVMIEQGIDSLLGSDHP
jgi:hypothetical protein